MESKQTELATKLGVSQPCISLWLTGKRLPTGLYKKILMEEYPELYERIVKIHKERKEYGS